jgi:hypothetical protein
MWLNACETKKLDTHSYATKIHSSNPSTICYSTWPIKIDIWAFPLVPCTTIFGWKIVKSMSIWDHKLALWQYIFTWQDVMVPQYTN